VTKGEGKVVYDLLLGVLSAAIFSIIKGHHFELNSDATPQSHRWDHHDKT